MGSRYSPYWDDALGVSHGELVAWLSERIEQMEEDLRVLRQLLVLLEGGSGWRPGEKPEEVREGRARLAVIYRGEDGRRYYVRVVPAFRMLDLRDLREYLEGVLRDIREIQARSWAPGLAELEVKPGPQGTVAEMIYRGLHSAVEVLKAKAAFKHAVTTAWRIIKAQRRNGG